MNLLQIPKSSGYPTEYLVARIRGRRVHLVKDWEDILSDPVPVETLLPTYYKEFMTEHAREGVWKRLLKEFRWIYYQMNETLRDAFVPFFMYFEIKTILLCFRHRTEKESKTDIDDILSFSLLSREVKEVLKKEGELPLILEEFEKKYLSPTGKPRGLAEAFSKAGLKGVEEEMTNGFFEQMISLKLSPVINDFFVFLIDIKNIMALYKHEKWGIKTAPEFINGGGISRSVLRKTAQESGISGILRLVHQTAGVSVPEAGISQIENALLAGMTKEIKAAAIKSADTGLILDYLWKIYIEAQNFSVLLYSGTIERKDLRKELVIL
jgi:vacuolar-type H+-ATPase subunit C/Vma6